MDEARTITINVTHDDLEHAMGARLPRAKKPPRPTARTQTREAARRLRRMQKAEARND